MARFRPRDHARTVEIIDGLFVNLDRRPEPAVQVIAEVQLRADETPNFVVGDSALFLPRLIFFGRRKGAFQAFDAAVYIFIGGLREPGDAGFAADNPLVDQAVENVRVALWLAIEESLVAAELANVALQDDFGFDSGDDSVHHLLPAKVARRRQQAEEKHRKCEPFAHQKLEPRLKNI